jgi:hypothetical protein
MPLDREICVSLGAGAASVTVPVEPWVPVVDVGLSVSEDGACTGVAVTLSVAEVLTPFQEAVMLAVVSVVAELVGMLRESVGLPAATVTEAGTGTTAGLLLESCTTAPPAGASPLRAITALVVWPPVIGEKIDRDFNEDGCTVSLTDAEVPLMLSVRVTGVGAVT